MMREMPAFAIEPDLTEAEFVELTRKQTRDEISPEESKRLRELYAAKASEGLRKLSPGEYQRYLELSKKDTYLPPESEEFAGLQRRLDKAGK